MTQNAFDAYTTAGILTADPVTLTTMLFDGALKAMGKARIHHDAGNRQGFINETGRAQLIVGELLCTLDLEQGEIAQNLSAIYSYCLRCIVESTLGDLERLDEAEKHIRRITDAWKVATAELRASAEAQPAGAEAAA